MDYQLHNKTQKEKAYLKRLVQSGKELSNFIDKKRFGWALLLVIVSSLAAIVSPYLLGVAIDTYITNADLTGLAWLILFLAVLFVVTGIATYFQQQIMGKASQDALFKLRGTIFEKLQSLPIAFFNQNKTGDLMSRLNNDTDKLNQFLSESILRFAGSAFTLLGIGGFILYLNWKLGLVLLSSTIFLLVITRIASPFIESSNRKTSASLGDFTSGVTEQLSNFKAIIAFDRRNFFEEYLTGLNSTLYKKSVLSGFLNQAFSPIYDFAGYIAQVAVLVYGIFLITQGEITIGVLIAFLTYALRFYDPLRWIADIFGNIQVSLASWGRIQEVLALNSDVIVKDNGEPLPQDVDSTTLMAWRDVCFGYTDDSLVVKHVSFDLKRGHTYALVGPTGGGKSTIASLMARLYDPSSGTIFWKDKDMHTYCRKELSSLIGVILQEPFLFSGTVADNIRYGNDLLVEINDEQLLDILSSKNMNSLIKRFPEGLQTPVQSGAENMSIGQKQLISFVRTILREPEFLILDEATANIDTVTESVLQELIDSLPVDTTKVIIAHRLNTIKNADEILFVGNGTVKRVADEAEVLELLKLNAKS